MRRTPANRSTDRCQDSFPGGSTSLGFKGASQKKVLTPFSFRRHLIEVCRHEGRALVTLDVDFANPLIYPPADFPGIAVIRIAKRATAAVLQAGLTTLARALLTEPLAGRLWIVERGRVRVYQPSPDV